MRSWGVKGLNQQVQQAWEDGSHLMNKQNQTHLFIFLT